MKVTSSHKVTMIIVLLLFSLVFILTSCQNKEGSTLDTSHLEEDPQTVDVKKSEDIVNDTKKEEAPSDNVTQADEIEKAQVDTPIEMGHLIKDNDRITEYFTLFNQSSKNISRIYETYDELAIEYISSNQNQIDISAVSLDNKTLYSKQKQLPDDESPFYMDNEIVGVNSNNGVKVFIVHRSDEFRVTEDLLDNDLSNALGKNMFCYDDFYFLEYLEDNSTYLFSSRFYDVETYKIPVEGNILTIRQLPSMDYMVVHEMNNNQIGFKIIDEKCKIKGTLNYSIEKDMKFKGVTISTYDRFNVYFSKKNKNESQVISITVNDLQVNNVYHVPILFEEIHDNNNIYAFIGLDTDQNKTLYVCDRNFIVLDQIDLGVNVESTFTHLTYNRSNDIKNKPFLSAIAEYNNDTYFIKIDLEKLNDQRSLIKIEEDEKINISPDNHVSDVYFNEQQLMVALTNFSHEMNVKKIKDSPYFVEGNKLYSQSGDLITEVREWEEDASNIDVISIGDSCNAFYRNNQYLFTHSLLNNQLVEHFYDQILADTPQPSNVYIDRATNEALIEDISSIYTLSYSKGKNIICNNLQDLGLVNGIKLYKKDSLIFLYDNYTFYSYDALNNQLVGSKFVEEMPFVQFIHQNESVLLYANSEMYQYDHDSNKIIEIKEPAISNRYMHIREEKGMLMADNYYFDIQKSMFRPIQLKVPLKFNGELKNTYYYPRPSVEMENTSPNNVQLYSTPFIPYTVGDVKIKLTNYKVIDGVGYIIEHSTNNLYRIENNELILVSDKSIRDYDISEQNLAYTSYIPNEQLYLYDIENNNEVLIYNGAVDSIHMDKMNVYYRDVDKNIIYQYNITSKENKQITTSNTVKNVYYTNQYIICQELDQFHLISKENLTILDSIEGEIMVFDEKNDLLYYSSASVITLIYDPQSKKSKVFAYDGLLCYGLLNDDMIGEVYYDGPGAIGVIDETVHTIGRGLYDINDTKLNDDYTISDVGVMYGLCFLVYHNDTLKYHKLVNWNDYITEGEYEVHIYHDTESVYFKRKEETNPKGYNWIKYTPSSGKEEIMDTLDTNNLKLIVGKERPA